MKTKQLSAFLALVLLPAAISPATGQETAPAVNDQIVTYEAAIHCSAYNVYMSAVLENEGAEEASYFNNRAIKWLSLAYARDGEGGDLADRELAVLVERLSERINGIEADSEIDELLMGVEAKCEKYMALAQEEYDAAETE